MTATRVPRTALVALAVAVVAVSWAAILIRMADAPWLSIAFWRLALATLILTPVAAPRLARGRRRRPSFGAALVLAAGALLALHFALWIASLFLTTVSSSVMLVATQPIFAGLVAGRLLAEPPSRRTWGAILLAVAGVAVVAAGDLAVSPRALLGDALAVGAAAAAAVYLILGRRARGSGPLALYLWLVNGVAALGLLAACVAHGSPIRGFSATTWLLLAGLAAGPHLAGHGLLNLAVRHMPAPAVNLALVGEPVLASIYAALLFAERPGTWFYLGAALILGGLLVEFVPPLLGPRARR